MAAEFKEAFDGRFDEVVWAGGPGGDADGDGAVGVQKGACVGVDFLFFVEVEVDDFFE